MDVIVCIRVSVNKVDKIFVFVVFDYVCKVFSSSGLEYITKIIVFVCSEYV